jgi:hypothetical protein
MDQNLGEPKYTGIVPDLKRFISRMESIIRRDDISDQHCPNILTRMLRGSNEAFVAKHINCLSDYGLSPGDQETTFTDITGRETNERTFITVGWNEPSTIDEYRPETIFDSSCLAHIMRLKNNEKHVWKKTTYSDNTLPNIQYYRKVWRPCHSSNMYDNSESMEENCTILYVQPVVDPGYWTQEWEVMNTVVALGNGIPKEQQRWVNKVDRNMFTSVGESHTRYYLWARPFVTSMLRLEAYKRLPQDDIESWIKLKRSEEGQSRILGPYHEYQDADTPVMKHLWNIDHIQTEIDNAMKALFEIVKANVTGLLGMCSLMSSKGPRTGTLAHPVCCVL